MARIWGIIGVALLLAQPVAAKEIRMAVGRSLPPYVFVDNWTGLEYDIVKQALAVEGHTIAPRHMALARVAKELESGLADAAMTMRPDSGVTAYYSDNHVTYRNFAITLASRDLRIEKAADMAGFSVIAFQRASDYLGEEFRKMAQANPQYREEAKQAVQPTLLFLNRVDVVVADQNIFGWFANAPEVKAKADTGQAVRFHPIFPPTDYHVAFREAGLRDSFNRGLKRIRENGEYQKIVARYSGFLRHEGAPGG